MPQMKVLRGSLLLVMVMHCAGICAQHPDVHEESFHTPVHSFGGLRYLRVEAQSGDTTALHFHRLPICYLTIAGTEVWLDETMNGSRTASLPTGWIGSDFYGRETPFLHRFAVTGDTPLLLIGVEKLGPIVHIPLPEMSPIYEADGFLVFKMTLLEFSFWPQTEYPGIVSEGILVAPSGEKRGPGSLIFAGEVYASEGNSVVWVVIPQ